MKVKKFVASSMPEAMKKIREDLGNNAVILNSKEVSKGGFLGLFVKKNIEVIAAADPYEKRPMKKIEKPIHTAEQENGLLLKEIRQLKKEMKQLFNNEDHNAKVFQNVTTVLKKHEISPSLQQRVMQELEERYEQHHLKTVPYETQKQWACDIFGRILKKQPIGGFDYSKPILNFVGPTGVGKTTTLAKIAAKAVLKDRKKIAFITTDTYRIAAIEQLKTYAQLLNVPIEVAYNAEDFKRARETFRHYDVVLVDSAGRNFREQAFLRELKEVIDFDDEMESYLVLALTSKYDDMKTIIERFKSLPINQVIFTKKDETSSYGAILNVAHDFALGTAYITDGQNVPDDIVEASERFILQSIFEVDEDG